MLRTITTIAVLPLFVLLLTSVQAFSGEYEFTTDKAAFMAEYPDLMKQDFSTFNISPGDSKTCPSPLNTLSSNQCVTPGVILPDLEISSGPPNFQNLRIIGSGFPGLGNPLNSLIDNNLNPFTVRFLEERYNVVGLNIGCTNPGLNACSGTVRVNVFDFSPAIIGSTTIDVTGDFDTFLGISSVVPISRVSISDDNLEKFLVGASVVYFGRGATNIPTMSEWGMIAMVAALGIIGLIYVQRRRNAQKA